MTERDSPPGTAEELARSLIASARLDLQPAPELVRHGILEAIGTAGVLGGGGAVARTTTGALRQLSLVKWLAATAVLGTAGVSAYTALNRTPSSTAATGRARPPERAIANGNQAPVAALPTTQASAPPASPARDTPEGAPNVPAPSVPRRATTSKTASPDQVNASEVSSLEGEVAALDHARAVAAGDPARALELLDRYDQAFPRGALRPEATYLRIQALSKSGQREAARTLAARFLASHPKSPHAAQLQALLSP